MLTCLGSPSLGPCPKKSAYNCEYNSIGIYRAYAYNCEYNSIGIYRAYSGWYGCRYMIWESLTTHDCPITSILHSGHHEQHALKTAAQQLSLPLLLALVCLHWNSLIFPWIAVSWCCCFLRGNVDRCYSIPLSHRISRQSLQPWPKIVPRHLHSVYASLEPFARPHVALLTVSLRPRLPGNKTIVFNSGFKWRSFANPAPASWRFVALQRVLFPIIHSTSQRKQISQDPKFGQPTAYQSFWKRARIASKSAISRSSPLFFNFPGPDVLHLIFH